MAVSLLTRIEFLAVLPMNIKDYIENHAEIWNEHSGSWNDTENTNADRTFWLPSGTPYCCPW